ncbi:MAG: hypothetical protein HON47_04420 [Candidatus Diapherotrites archaeon]|jgi:putative membrane protein|uniref:DUF112 domain-containing protein n=1 Tax=Candidatus Iainarchaeum sp. TaxID=3101447 RepID=A0A8T5GF93_9ARCH|nr:hypothetical protein [Candidatus Diapherotrites archaeon]MBT7240888.1 hypothetical protein [Candidatus Diapherotrites archaeon]
MILFLLLGIIAGTVTGLVPGIHSNNISLLLVASPLFGSSAIVFTLAMVITQSFVDFIPAIFIGAPNVDTFEGVLPGHKLFTEGKGFEAVCLTVFGGIVSLIVGVFILGTFSIFLTESWDSLRYLIPIILIFVLITIISKEQTTKKKIIVAGVIVAASSQGLLFTNQIFPLIVGYFGLPTILYSLNKTPIESKQDQKVEIEIKSVLEGFVGVVGGIIVSVLPGIGSNLAAGIIRLFREKIKTKNYLVLLGSINTSAFFFSFSVLFLVEKARNGAMIVLKDQIFFTSEEYILGIGVMLIASGFAGLITIFLAKKISNWFSKNKIKFLSLASIVIMLVSVFLFNGLLGLFVLLFSGSLGFFVVLQKVGRSSCLSSLIIPTIFFYTFILY